MKHQYYTTAAELKMISVTSNQTNCLTVHEKLVRDNFNDEMRQLAKLGSRNIMKTIKLDNSFHKTFIKDLKQKKFNVQAYVSEPDHIHIYLNWGCHRDHIFSNCKSDPGTRYDRFTNPAYFWGVFTGVCVMACPYILALNV